MSCSKGSSMLHPTERPPASRQPRLAASIAPGPPPVITANSASANLDPRTLAARYMGSSSPMRADPNTQIAVGTPAMASKPSTSSAEMRITRQGSSWTNCGSCRWRSASSSVAPPSGRGADQPLFRRLTIPRPLLPPTSMADPRRERRSAPTHGGGSSGAFSRPASGSTLGRGGTEDMRCPSCGTDNRAGRKFCSSCGAALALVCPSCGSPNEQGERFCGECGAPLESQDAPAAAQAVTARGAVPPDPGPEEERRVATILFADLAGFTSMSEGMDPEAVKALAAHCATLMSAEVRRFGGTVSSVMGDAIMAMFGAPVAHEDDAERAIRAAAAMRERIEAVENAPKRLQLHVGINTGETLAGLIGPDEARDYTAMGDTTNTAARLMS